MDLVAANVNAEALLSLQSNLLRVTVPGGRLILSGFTLRNVDRLAQSFAAEVIESLESGNWRALILRKR
jgi:ribosomal protein L11 methylase PrmA